MPWFKYCGTVKKGEVFVFIDNPKSFDSRYFQIIKTFWYAICMVINEIFFARIHKNNGYKYECRQYQ
jgi:type IV secretory pathway protease TraF